MVDEFIEGFRDKNNRMWGVSWLEEFGEAPQEREEYFDVNKENDKDYCLTQDHRPYVKGIGAD